MYALLHILAQSLASDNLWSALNGTSISCAPRTDKSTEE